MLLLPITAYTNDAALDGLEVFSVDVNTGLAQTGTINHAALAGDGYTPHVDRSFVIGDTIYSVSNLGLMATQKGDLSEIGHAVFPAAVVEGGGGATRGGVPMPVDDKGV